MDYFDASINRIAAWVIGSRNASKPLLAALLEPTERLLQLEAAGDYTARLALMEEQKLMPLGAVWNHYCQTMNVPPAVRWLEAVPEIRMQRAVAPHLANAPCQLVWQEQKFCNC
ncbi:MAG: L-rhamnose isomerase [Pirellulaceae bacterium]